ncbi:MAG: PIN domain-containing protein [Parvularculaceae bacterium]
MKFVDSSVLVAAAHENHPFFEASHRFLSRCRRENTGVAAHGAIETYSALTRMPKSLGFSAAEAAAYVARLVDTRLRPFTLSELEIMSLIAAAPDRGVSGGRIYDAIHARTAKKAGASAIVTWNEKHFIGLEPSLK